MLHVDAPGREDCAEQVEAADVHARLILGDVERDEAGCESETVKDFWAFSSPALAISDPPALSRALRRGLWPMRGYAWISRKAHRFAVRARIKNAPTKRVFHPD